MFIRENGDLTSTAVVLITALVMLAVFLIGALGGAMEASHLYYSHERCTWAGYLLASGPAS